MASESNLGDTYAGVTSRSYHTGGVNALLMDGSVDFITDSIELATFRALGARANHEVPSMGSIALTARSYKPSASWDDVCSINHR